MYVEGVRCTDGTTMESFDGCGRAQPTYRRTGLELTMKWKQPVDENIERQSKITPDHVRQMFKDIPDDICRLLGMDPKYSRPEWMILTILPVPPMCVRPSVLSSNNARCQDDLTYNLASILEANNKLRDGDRQGTAAHIMDKHWADLQLRCASLVNNDISNMQQLCQKNGRPLKTLTARLKGMDEFD